MISGASWGMGFPAQLLQAIQERLSALAWVTIVDDDLSRSSGP